MNVPDPKTSIRFLENEAASLHAVGSYKLALQAWTKAVLVSLECAAKTTSHTRREALSNAVTFLERTSECALRLAKEVEAQNPKFPS